MHNSTTNVRVGGQLKKLKPWVRGTYWILSWVKLIWSLWTLIRK